MFTLKFKNNKNEYEATKNIPVRYKIILYFLKFIIFKISFIINGVEIAKKKKCQVHRGQDDLILLLKKKRIVVIIEIFVKLFVFFDLIKNIPNIFIQNKTDINLIPNPSVNKNEKVSLLTKILLVKLFATPLSGKGNPK